MNINVKGINKLILSILLEIGSMIVAMILSMVAVSMGYVPELFGHSILVIIPGIIATVAFVFSILGCIQCKFFKALIASATWFGTSLAAHLCIDANLIQVGNILNAIALFASFGITIFVILDSFDKSKFAFTTLIIYSAAAVLMALSKFGVFIGITASIGSLAIFVGFILYVIYLFKLRKNA